jgi:hypothetical protein
LRANGLLDSRTSKRSNGTRTSCCAGRGPFGLVFADGGAYDWERIIELLELGGLLVKDDLTPGRAVDGDPVRELLLRDPRLAAVEILTTPQSAAIVAVRRK